MLSLAGGLAAGMGLASYSWLTREDEARQIAAARQNVTAIPGLGQEELAILSLGTMAPSGHNAQPWTVTIKEPQRWIIGTDKTRWLPAVDPENREMILSIGAFIENLTLAARIYGYEAEINRIGENNFSPEIAEVRVTKREKPADIPREVIENRRTVRKQLLKNALSQEDINYLVGGKSDAIVYYPRESSAGKYLSEACLLANRAQAYRADAQKELAAWIRWSNREAREYRNGLTPESMEMSGITRWYAKHFLRKDDVLSKTFRQETIQLVEEQLQNCAGWLVVQSDSSSVSALIEAGRLLQSAWLRAHRKIIAFHPMTQVLEEDPWRTETATALGHTGTIQFVVRIGYIMKHLPPVSLRMPLSKIVFSAAG